MGDGQILQTHLSRFAAKMGHPANNARGFAQDDTFLYQNVRLWRS
jgi:hypothetical protein